MELSKRCKDITGERFGKLVAIAPEGYTYNYNIKWRCICDCGEEHIVNGQRLRTGLTTHCGCETYKKVSEANTKDLTGQKFGKLTAISNTGRQQNNCYIWKCECDCGNIIEVMSGSLGSGNTKSCGCVGLERIRQLGFSKKLPNKQGLKNALFSKYLLGAKRRDISFALSQEEFEDLIIQDCYYCGNHPSQIFTQCSSKLSYNGIDRVENNEGYTKDNCVPCCKICNTMKMTLSQEEFLEHILKIADRITNIKIYDGVEQ
jgi:hypothetical protein